MYVRRLGTLVEVQAPAKLNLFLEVLARRNDGFHEIETLMIPIRAYDTLTLSDTPDGQIRLRCRGEQESWDSRPTAEQPDDDGGKPALRTRLPEGPENLVFRALQVLREAAGVGRGVAADLTKRIPLAAGLGGGSSDAAAALLGANSLWQLGWSVDQLAKIAAAIGSDVPFFLYSGAAICRGRGEEIEPLGSLPTLHAVVAKPPLGLSTPEVYSRCRPAERPGRANDTAQAIRTGRIRDLRRCVFNRLQEAAEDLTPWIGTMRSAFDHAGCEVHQLSGSGSAYFGICRHAAHARSVAGRLRAAGLGWVFQTTTSPLTYRRA